MAYNEETGIGHIKLCIALLGCSALTFNGAPQDIYAVTPGFTGKGTPVLCIATTPKGVDGRGNIIVLEKYSDLEVAGITLA